MSAIFLAGLVKTGTSVGASMSTSMGAILLSFACTNASMQDCTIYTKAYPNSERCIAATKELSSFREDQILDLNKRLQNQEGVPEGMEISRPVLVTYCRTSPALE